MPIKLHHILFMGLALAACETVVDVEAPPYEPRIVPQGFFTVDSLWVVQVGRTVDFTSADRPGYVDDAIVEIWQGGARLESLTRADTGLYVSQSNLPGQGVEYTLKVRAPGFSMTEGSDQIPAPARVKDLSAVITDPGQDLPTLRRRVNILMQIEDEPERNNYYGLFVIQARLVENRRTGSFTPIPPSVFIFESSNPAFEESEFSFLDTESKFYANAFFADALFDGQTYTLDLSILYDVSDPQANVQTHRAFGVVLLSVSEDFFLYWKTASKQALTNENPFSEPLRVHSNMSEGLGVFAGFQYDVYPVAVDTLALNTVCDAAPAYRSVCDSLFTVSPLAALRKMR